MAWYWWYIAGVCTPIAICAVVVIAMMALDSGRMTTCRTCGYSTGPFTTKRIVRWLRWTWHAQVASRRATHGAGRAI